MGGRTSLPSGACSAGGFLSQANASATVILSVLTRAVRGCGAGGGATRSSTACRACTI